MSDKHNEELLIRENTGLIIHIAKIFRPRNPLELDEFVQLGRIGLLKAIRRYNSDKGSLSNYAWHCISGEIKRHLSKERKYEANKRIGESEGALEPNTSLWEYLPESLTETEKEVIQRRLENNTFGQIGELLGGYKKGWANKVYHGAIKKIRAANGQV